MLRSLGGSGSITETSRRSRRHDEHAERVFARALDGAGFAIRRHGELAVATRR